MSRGYKNCIIARLWGEFGQSSTSFAQPHVQRLICSPLPARNRAINLHGEENARLSRDQMLTADYEVETSRVLSLASYLLFNVPETHLSTLKKLFVDDIAYTEHWQKFIRGMIQEWIQAVLGVSFILHFLFTWKV